MEGSGQIDIYCLPAKYFIGVLHEGQTSVWDGHHLLHTVVTAMILPRQKL